MAVSIDNFVVMEQQVLFTGIYVKKIASNKLFIQFGFRDSDKPSSKWIRVSDSLAYLRSIIPVKNGNFPEIALNLGFISEYAHKLYQSCDEQASIQELWDQFTNLYGLESKKMMEIFNELLIFDLINIPIKIN